MSGVVMQILLFTALIAASIAGFLLANVYLQKRREGRLRKSIIENAPEVQGFRDLCIRQMMRLSQSKKTTHSQKQHHAKLKRSVWFRKAVLYTGLSKHISEEAFCEMRLRCATLFALGGLCLGLCASLELGCILAITGGCAGWIAPTFALKKKAAQRLKELEAHLPEMIDVLIMGMRSGMNFDRALQLYIAHFDTTLAKEMSCAQSLWIAGLQTRAEALSDFSQSYKSQSLQRVLEICIRGLEMGTSVVEGLASEAAQARALYRSRREEKIAKAPVKMMIPTGSLILPAMLLLVMGPVLLELIEGGF